VGRLHREQPELANAPPGRQHVVHEPELLIEGKRPIAANRNHADHFVAALGDDVLVLVVKTIDVPAVGVRRVLRDLLNKRLIEEPGHLLEF